MLNDFVGVDIQYLDSKKYYIINAKGRFLHYDGVWRYSTVDDNDVFTGLYKSRNAAQKVLKKYKPEDRIGEITPGRRFRMNFQDNGNVYLCIQKRKYNHIVYEEEKFVYFVNMNTFEFSQTCREDRSGITYVD